KATVEMESPVAGTVLELAGEVGDQVSIGSALVVIETDGDAEAGESATLKVEAADEAKLDAVEAQYEAENPGVEEEVAATPQPVTPAPAQAGAQMGNIREDARRSVTTDTDSGPASGRDASQVSLERGGRAQPDAPSPGKEDAGKPVLASPAVRARARDLGIDLADVKTDGDRVRHADLDAYLRYGAGEGYHAPHVSRARADETVKVIGMRRRIAENMAASKRTIPHFTYVEEIDVTALEEMRADLNANRGNRPKLTMLPFLIVAICRTIPGFPMINARYDDEAGVVTRHGKVHLGMATQTDAGLMVPVIRDAQDRNVWQLASEIGRLADAARSGKAKSEELSGSTLTVTSLGPLGGVATTPVINRPEVAIIGPNKIVERPIFHGDDIVRAKLMNLSISCDHRVVDGWDAANFVQALKKLLETPVLLFAD
ncbi:MAG: dihydrolipoamide acetyltransferase family protein, partial [Sphingomonas sp.]